METTLDCPTSESQNGGISPSDRADDLGGKYLTFVLANEEYGLEILKVRELMGIMDITKVPQTPEFVRGVINLRGKVIPVIDLREKFSLPPKEYDDQTCIIVVQVDTLMGIIVDTMQQVHDIPSADIAPPPEMGATVDTRFLLGLGKVGDSVKLLLDVDKLLSTDALVQVLEEVA